MKLLDRLLGNMHEDFFHKSKEGYSVFGYKHLGSYGNETPEILLEGRFSKFDLEGNCICRPMRKAFNYGESRDPHSMRYQSIPMSQWMIADKFDGSLINPVIVDGVLLWMTKSGHESEVAQAFTKWFDETFDAYQRDHIYQLASYGYTLNFEWIGPQNRIVCDYDRAKIVLLSIRSNTTGKTFYPEEDRFGMKRVFEEYPQMEFAYRRPLLETFPNVETLDEFMEDLSKRTDIEGYIVSCGEMAFKAKTDWYLERHGDVGLRWSLSHMMKGKAHKYVLTLLHHRDNLDDLTSFLSDDEQFEFLSDSLVLEASIETMYQNHQKYVDELKEAFGSEGVGAMKKQYAIHGMKSEVLKMSNAVFLMIQDALTLNEYRDIFFKNVTTHKFTMGEILDVR